MPPRGSLLAVATLIPNINPFAVVILIPPHNASGSNHKMGCVETYHGGVA